MREADSRREMRKMGRFSWEGREPSGKERRGSGQGNTRRDRLIKGEKKKIGVFQLGRKEGRWDRERAERNNA